ncbi:hypothetical protein GOQ29_06040 [Clostridium sp. D2Q-14]|uniref:hypothetical protein n=1 Tax=Anaeromonas gelatinilytica TaxID=2683194 RepID=UPI00193C7B5B|nr:hypothetical protein [Anaeromonas gelatinilytica]MBS4535180.1 hypothetical protein [Anaeromonas gelatinilytica]
MNNENKTYELITKMYNEMQEEFIKLNNEIKNMKNDLNDFREETHYNFNKLESKLDDVEANNANRHITLDSKIEKINKNMSTVEEVTAKNWIDIIELKK